MTDRAMQALYLLALAPIAETTGDPNSYGFRIERSTADAMGQLFVCLSKKVSAQWVLEADIKGCFDHINHDWLITNVPTDKVVLRKWLKAGVIHKGQLQATDAGTPQGGIVSPSLANLVLDGLESQLKQHLGVTKAKKLKINVVRYADDFVITGTSREVLETEVRPWVEQFLGNIFETREVIQVDGSKAVEFVNTIHDVLTSPSYLKEVANARRLPAACRACDERMLCQANCGVLHEQWNQQDECPGFKTFIKRVRFLVEEEGVRPKSVLQGANQLPQNLIALLLSYGKRLLSVDTLVSLEKKTGAGSGERTPEEIALDQALERNPHQLQINMEPGHKPTPSIAQLLEQSAGDRLVVNEEAIRAARNPKKIHTYFEEQQPPRRTIIAYNYGGEPTAAGPEYFLAYSRIMDEELPASAGYEVRHVMLTSMLGVDLDVWAPIWHEHCNGYVQTSYDGDMRSSNYVRKWEAKVREAVGRGLKVATISVVNSALLEQGPSRTLDLLAELGVEETGWLPFMLNEQNDRPGQYDRFAPTMTAFNDFMIEMLNHCRSRRRRRP
ncbi:hypothetical protein G6F24_012735 [Rhizopus arrhizus]|nr:hypothetical protein G6F24_012735 [Rhizopus arrhizus]